MALIWFIVVFSASYLVWRTIVQYRGRGRKK